VLRKVWPVVGVLLALPSLGSDAPKEYDGAVQDPVGFDEHPGS
jgi:hypothetical protein